MKRHHYTYPILVTLAIISCLLPWAVGPSAGLTFNARDLAEWASLTPAVQNETPPLFTALMLRLPLACAGMLLVWALEGRQRYWGILVALILSIALLPPFEFVRELGNPNYQQQAGLALVTFIVSVSVLFSSLRVLQAAMVITGLVGAFAAFFSIGRLEALFEGVALTIQIGIGGVFTFSLLLLIAVFAGGRYRYGGKKRGGVFFPALPLRRVDGVKQKQKV